MQILKTEQIDYWKDVLKRCPEHDVYHLPEYHRIAEQQGEGTANLFVYTEASFVIALPLLLRPIAALSGLEQVGRDWNDATSVYGYSGVIASHPEIPPQILDNFRSSLQATLQDRRVLNVFARLHPIIPQHTLLSGLGHIKSSGCTVSIDLTLPSEAQVAKYRSNHRRDINKLHRFGVTCSHDDEYSHLGTFVDIYYETMQRVGAGADYFFSHSYFEQLISTMQRYIHLFVVRFEEELICGGIFTICNGIVQYHLGGTSDKFLPWAPMKLLFDTVRRWSIENGLRVLHLGGGVGAREDSLFKFKAGFSDRRHEFLTWRWILSLDDYDAVCREKARWNERTGLATSSTTYFPEYRCPSIHLSSESTRHPPGFPTPW